MIEVDWTTIGLAVVGSITGSYVAVRERLTKLEANVNQAHQSAKDANDVAKDACGQLRDHIRDYHLPRSMPREHR